MSADAGPSVERGQRLAEEVRGGQPPRAGATADRGREPDRAAEAALRVLYPLAGAAHLVGVTGAPGAGKSTLVAALVTAARAAVDPRPVAVIAIDPSSPITGGAILGDRVRMQQHAGDRDVFIRSMAARGHLGGLATSTIAAAAVLDAAGFPLIFIETVGTGQSEVEVAAIADTTLVVQAPEMGDEVQAIKAGLLEVADLVAVTKADRPGADRAAAHLRAMLTVGVSEDRARGDRPTPKRPEVVLVSGGTGQGVADLAGGPGPASAAARSRGRRTQRRDRCHAALARRHAGRGHPRGAPSRTATGARAPRCDGHASRPRRGPPTRPLHRRR